VNQTDSESGGNSDDEADDHDVGVRGWLMQGLGRQDEDRTGGFEGGGWATPFWDGQAATALNEIYGRADTFLFGRRTYEIFAG